MRRQPAAHPSPDARRLNRRAVITLGGTAAGAIGVAGGLLASRQAAGIEAGDPPADDRGDTLTPHREAYYRRGRF